MNFIANRVRIHRLSKGLTQKALARLSGVPQPALSRIEKGADFQLSTLCKLATALDMQPAQLLSEIAPIALNKKKAFQRQNLDGLTKSLAGRKISASEIFREALPWLRLVYSKQPGYVRQKDLQLAWAKLKRTFSNQELSGMQIRVQKNQSKRKGE